MRAVVLMSVLFLAACGPKSSPKAAGATGPSVHLDSVKFDHESHTLYVQAGLEPGAALKDRTEPVYLGVTGVTSDGTEIDLMVNELFPGDLAAPMLFYAELDTDIDTVLIGAWDHKVRPCSVDRYGCKQFGFVLDGPLASWPPGLYTDGTRQRIPPQSFDILVVGSEKSVDKLGAALAKDFLPELAPFGANFALLYLQTGAAGSPVSDTSGARVVYKDAHDAYFAKLIAQIASQRFGVPLTAELGDSGAGFVAVYLPAE